MRVENLTTLIYITRGNDCLFIRKTRKGDMNLDKYLGIGGHFESDETAEECVLRELSEEASISSGELENFSYRGLITFISSEYPTEYMHVFTASVPSSFELPERSCDRIHEGLRILHDEVPLRRICSCRAFRDELVSITDYLKRHFFEALR